MRKSLLAVLLLSVVAYAYAEVKPISGGEQSTYSLAKTFTSNVLVSGDVYTSSGTWTPTFTGFSSNPVPTTSNFRRIGDLVCVDYYGGFAGTSNTTAFTITLPFKAKYNQHGLSEAYDNSAYKTAPGYVSTNPGSTQLDLYAGIGGTAWTASNVKDVIFNMCYTMTP